MRTIERAIDILETVLSQESEIGLVDLAKKTNLNVSTTRRFCSTLVKRGYLYQRERRGNYSIGLRVLQFIESPNIGVTVKNQAYQFLVKLRDEISEATAISIFDGTQIRGIAIVYPDHVLQTRVDIANKAPLHCTAVGKLYLAYMRKARFERYINEIELPVLTKNTITDKSQMKCEIEAVMKEGIAFDNEEFVPGVRAIAAPIVDKNGDIIAALSVLAPSIRMSRRKLNELAPILKIYALEISRALVYGDE